MKKRHYLFLVIFIGLIFWPRVSVEAQTKQVFSPEDFVSAWNDQTVSKIELKNNIEITYSNTTLKERLTDIEVTGYRSSDVFGDYFRLFLSGGPVKNGSLKMGTPTDGKPKKMHFHDIVMENVGGDVDDDSGIITHGGTWIPSDVNTTSKFWEFTFGNVLVPKGKTVRVARVTRGQVNIYGKVYFSTLGENFYTGGVNVAEGADYYGEITNRNYSAVWFRDSIKPGDTGSGDFIIGDNAKVKLRNTGTGVTFPAIFRNWQNIIVGENAEYTATVPGTSVAFGGTGKKFIAKKGSKVTLTSTGTYSSISTTSPAADNYITPQDLPINAVNAEFRMEPGSNLYVIGKSNIYGMVNWSTGSGNQFNLNSPNQFDIRNNLNGSGYLYRAVHLGSEKTNTFNLSNSFLDMWEMNANLNNTPKFSYPTVTAANFKSNGINTQSVVSSNSKLMDDYNATKGDVRRMTGLNTPPVIELQRLITDADKNFNNFGRVRTGIVPDDTGLDSEGNLHFIKLYAPINGASAEITDKNTENSSVTKPTLNNGYFGFTNEKFYTAGNTVSGKASRAGLVGENQDFPEVIDITPPEPAKVTQTLTTNSKSVSGKEAEVDATVYVKINNTMQTETTKVGADGSWKYDFKTKLNPGDTVTIYLEDNAGKAPTSIIDESDVALSGQPKRSIPLDPPAPSTNNDKGNRNPDSDMNYRDTVFKAATKLTITDIQPPTPKIDKIARALTKDDKGNQVPQGDGTPLTENDWQGKVTKVNNTLSYRIAIQIPGTSGQDLQKAIYNAKVTDKIPDNLTFNKDDVKVWSYKKGDTMGLPIRYKNDVIGADGKHQFNMGDIDLVSSEATPIPNPIIEYDETSRLLTVGVGDRSKNENDKYNAYGYEGSNKYGHLSPGDKVVIEFPTTVTSEAVKTSISNKGVIKGYSAEEVNDSPLEYKEVSVTSNEAINPGGAVSGELSLVSAPKEITFAKTNLIDYNKMIGSDKTSIDQPLVVKDTLQDKDWKVTVNLIEEMSHIDNGNVYELPNSLSVRYKKKDNVLTLNNPVTIYQSSLSEVTNQEEFNISDSWGKKEDEDGIKMKASRIPQTGEYQGKIVWSLENTQ